MIYIESNRIDLQVFQHWVEGEEPHDVLGFLIEAQAMPALVLSL